METWRSWPLGGEPTAFVLNSRVISHYLLNIDVYAHIFELLSTLVKEASLCLEQRLIQRITTDQCAGNECQNFQD